MVSVNKLIEFKDAEGNIYYPNDAVEILGDPKGVTIKYASGLMIERHKCPYKVTLSYNPATGIYRAPSITLGEFRGGEFIYVPNVHIDVLPVNNEAIIWACPYDYSSLTKSSYPKVIIAGFSTSAIEVEVWVMATAIGRWK